MTNNTSTTQPPALPQPIPQQPELLGLDPSNPIGLILLLTAFLRAIDEPIQALADLLQQLNKLLETLRKNNRK
jgi:hypothetical protein